MPRHRDLAAALLARAADAEESQREPGPSADAAEGSETDESDISGMTELATLRRAEAGPSSNAGASLPTFFRPRPRPGSLRARCEAAVRAMWLEDHADAVLSQEELESIWFWLKEASSDAGADQEMLSYEGFCRVTDRFQETFGARARRRVHGFLRASTFLRLAKDDRGRISALSLFELLMRQCFTARLRLDLAKYDADGDGKLTLDELSAYLEDAMLLMRPLAPLFGSRAGPDAPVAEDLSSFVPTWLDMSVLKFAFYHARNGRLPIRDLLVSPVTSELHLLRELGGADEASMRRLVENWFSVQKSRWLYSMFDDLDVDRDGLLSREEFARLPVCRLSPLFASRLFQEHATGRRRGAYMTFRDFLTFLIAWEGRMTPRALAYFWPVLDLGCKGYLTQADVYQLFKSVCETIREANPDADYRVEDVKDEIFDMVKPRDPLRITLQDVVASKRGAVVVGMLSDMNAFISYDLRESMASAGDE